MASRAAPLAPDETTTRIRTRRLEPVAVAGKGLTLVRVVMLVVGVGGIALASYAVYESHDGTATAALIGACVVLVFLAAFGHQITSFKYGEAELLLKQAKAADDLGDEEARDALIGAAVQVGLPSGVEARSKSLNHKISVLAALDRVLTPDTKLASIDGPPNAVATRSGRRVGVHARRGVKDLDSFERNLLRRELRDDKKRTLEGLLVVACKAPDHRTIEPAETRLRSSLGVPVRVVGWQADDPDERLGEALDGLFGELPG